jgi:short-subunit dehydrogenase
MNKTALITGAIERNGKTTAQLLAKKAINILCGRRDDRLKSLKRN